MKKILIARKRTNDFTSIEKGNVYLFHLSSRVRSVVYFSCGISMVSFFGFLFLVLVYSFSVSIWWSSRSVLKKFQQLDSKGTLKQILKPPVIFLTVWCLPEFSQLFNGQFKSFFHHENVHTITALDRFH